MLVNAILISTLALAPFAAEQDGVRVTTEVSGSHYVWTVENVSAEPITRFFIEAHHTFGFQVPEDWEYRGGKPEWIFEAWTTNARAAIRKGESRQFALQINNRGAGLGTGPCKITLRDDQMITIPMMWQPVPESSRSVYLIPLTLVALALLHTVLVRRRESRIIDDA